MQNPDAEKEIISSRLLSFPIATIYHAFENPEQLKLWWGPNGFTNTFHEFNLVPGGRWRFTMHGPEAGHYENDCEFTSIEKPHLIAWKRYSQPYFNMELHFEAISETSTRLTFRMIFDSEETCRKVKAFAADKNEENFDRLQALLGNLAQPLNH